VPIVIVETWVGKTDAQKATIIKGITQAFVDIGEAPDQVKIVIHEIPKENWGSNGEQASKWGQPKSK
jgi:4-oxalocrotonate tautomerase